jgi:CTD small phosphatase-like protein 2
MKKPKLEIPSVGKKVSLEVFESRFSDKDPVFYIESTQNLQGNYFNYVSNVLKNLKNFDSIDFVPSVMKKAVCLDHTEKKSLFLDLDETLVHADFCYYYKGHDIYLDFLYEHHPVTIPLIKRPYLIDFLDFCAEHFDVYIFTASRREYADCILDHIESKKKYFKQRFYRDNCIIIKNRVFIKDLRIFLNRDLKDLILIDNSLFSFTNQLSNGILITSFYSDPNDKELLNIKNYLGNMRLANAEDVRNINRKVFNFESIKEKL